MKKRNLVIACLALALALCVACVKKDGQTSSRPEEIVVPSDSELPSAAEAVELIINDEEVLELEMDDSLVEETEKEEDTSIECTLYYVKGSYSEFQTEVVTMNVFSPDEILSGLARHNIVPWDCNVESFEEKTDENGEKILSLELSHSFNDYLDTMSEDAGSAIVASITNTFLEAYDASVVEMLDKSITWCEVPTDPLEE